MKKWSERVAAGEGVAEGLEQAAKLVKACKDGKFPTEMSLALTNAIDAVEETYDDVQGAMRTVVRRAEEVGERQPFQQGNGYGRSHMHGAANSLDVALANYNAKLYLLKVLSRIAEEHLRITGQEL